MWPLIHQYRCLEASIFTYLQVLAAFIFFFSQMIHVRNIYLHLPQKLAQFSGVGNCPMTWEYWTSPKIVAI